MRDGHPLKHDPPLQVILVIKVAVLRVHHVHPASPQQALLEHGIHQAGLVLPIRCLPHRGKVGTGEDRIWVERAVWVTCFDIGQEDTNAARRVAGARSKWSKISRQADNTDRQGLAKYVQYFVGTFPLERSQTNTAAHTAAAAHLESRARAASYGVVLLAEEEQVLPVLLPNQEVRVADDHRQGLGAGQGHVKLLRIAQEADLALFLDPMAPGQGRADDDDLLLPSLEVLHLGLTRFDSIRSDPIRSPCSFHPCRIAQNKNSRARAWTTQSAPPKRGHMFEQDDTRQDLRRVDKQREAARPKLPPHHNYSGRAVGSQAFSLSRTRQSACHVFQRTYCCSSRLTSLLTLSLGTSPKPPACFGGISVTWPTLTIPRLFFRRSFLSFNTCRKEGKKNAPEAQNI